MAPRGISRGGSRIDNIVRGSPQRMTCRVVNGRPANAFCEDARRILFDFVLQIGPAAMVRKLFLRLIFQSPTDLHQSFRGRPACA